MPVMHTTDGEELVLCEAHYAVQDEAAVRARLASVEDLELGDAAYRWLNREGSAAMGAVAVTLGHVRLSGDELVLETMSRERHDRGKRLLEGALGGLVSYRGDSMQAPEAAGRAHRERGDQQPGPDDVPDDVECELVGQYLQDHYRRWLDAPLPALDGKTPRQAARTRWGRAQVDALLKDIENSSLAIPGGEAVDFAALRRELALDPSDEPPDELAYDAARAPEPAGWLAMDDAVKAQAVEQHHRSLAAHPDLPNARLHALLHVIVENQLAGGDPPEVDATLERLSRAGLTRHEAIHAIGSVVAEAIFNITKNQTAFDREAAARALSQLKPQSWRFALPR